MEQVERKTGDEDWTLEENILLFAYLSIDYL